MTTPYNHQAAQHLAAMEHAGMQLAAAIKAAAGVSALVPAQPAGKYLHLSLAALAEHIGHSVGYHVYLVAATAAWRFAARMALEKRLVEQGEPVELGLLYISGPDNRAAIEVAPLETARYMAEYPHLHQWAVRYGCNL